MNELFELSDVYMNPNRELEKFTDESGLLGELCINRVAGIAYGNLKRLANLRTMKEFENTVTSVYKDNLNRTRTFKKNVEIVAKMLKDADFPYALLKGAYLTTQVYEEGCRTSNDLDILVEECNVAKCQNILKENGFIQGYYNKNENVIVPATRREIILSRMNYGETVPFVKLMGQEFFNIDINFSVDFKPEKDKFIVRKLLSRIKVITFANTYFYTLDKTSFLIHLCCHLYKEATTMEWVKERRDLQLYKFSDINVFLHEFTDKLYDDLYTQVKDFGTEKECYYTLYNTAIIFPRLREVSKFNEFVERIRPKNLDFMKQIVDPQNQKTYAYKLSFEDWFFVKDKEQYLTEI